MQYIHNGSKFGNNMCQHVLSKQHVSHVEIMYSACLLAEISHLKLYLLKPVLKPSIHISIQLGGGRRMMKIMCGKHVETNQTCLKVLNC
jgi:hypothetical protein